jgi:hypothetical protein
LLGELNHRIPAPRYPGLVELPQDQESQRENPSYRIIAVNPAQDTDRWAGRASVCIDRVTVNNLSVWRRPDGKLKVYWPSYRKHGYSYGLVSLSQPLRREIERAVAEEFEKRRLERKHKEEHTAKGETEPRYSHADTE